MPKQFMLCTFRSFDYTFGPDSNCKLLLGLSFEIKRFVGNFSSTLKSALYVVVGGASMHPAPPIISPLVNGASCLQMMSE